MADPSCNKAGDGLWLFCRAGKHESHCHSLLLIAVQKSISKAVANSSANLISVSSSTQGILQLFSPFLLFPFYFFLLFLLINLPVTCFYNNICLFFYSLKAGWIIVQKFLDLEIFIWFKDGLLSVAPNGIAKIIKWN